jgi:hypothetical protein
MVYHGIPKTWRTHNLRRNSWPYLEQPWKAILMQLRHCSVMSLVAFIFFCIVLVLLRFLRIGDHGAFIGVQPKLRSILPAPKGVAQTFVFAAATQRAGRRFRTGAHSDPIAHWDTSLNRQEG